MRRAGHSVGSGNQSVGSGNESVGSATRVWVRATRVWDMGNCRESVYKMVTKK